MKEMCDECDHRINAYCRAYKAPIKILTVEKCKRKKIKGKKESEHNGGNKSKY